MLQRRAFTLIELVAVIVVLAILGGVAIPKFINSADRARTSADESALASMNTALTSAYMSHRANDAPSTQWITSIDTIARSLETGKLPEGWTVDDSQLVDQRGNLYNFIAETDTAAARIALSTGEPPVVAGGAGGGGGGAGGGGGGAPAGARSPADIQAMTAAQLIAASLTPEEFASLTAEQLAALTPEQLAAFSPAHIAALTGTQLVALSYAQVELVAGSFTAAQIPLIRPDQIAMLSATAYGALTPAQIAALTSDQRAERAISENARARNFEGIRSLSVAAIKYLLPAQIAAINSDYQMSLLSADRRAALTADQVKALNARLVSIAYLTDAQRAQLTADQFATIRTDDVRYVPVARLGDVPSATIGAINSDYAMSLISADRRAAFSSAQVQALNARLVSIAYLTDAQRAQLTADQFATIRTDDIRYVPVARLGDVPPATVGAINSDYAMSLIPADRRAAFSTAQVQALNANLVSIAYLTDNQRTSLTAAQMASIRTDDVRHVPVSRLGDVPPATVGAINSDYAMSLISADRRAAFNTAQVQAMNSAIVSIAYLTDAQRSNLTTAQVAAIRTDDIRHVPVSRLGDVPAGTVGNINSDYAMSLISAERRAAFNTAQVQAMNSAVVSIAYLTEGQRAELTQSQVAQIRTDDVRHVTAARMAEVPAGTVGNINSDYAMSLVSADRRAAFTTAQVRAINTAVVSLAYLTDAQRDQTTSAQLAALRADDIRHAPATRISEIPPATVAQINSDYGWSLVSTPRVQGLSRDQINAISPALYATLRPRLTPEQQSWR